MPGMQNQTRKSTARLNKPEDVAEAIENDREFKAYVYQQLVDLQPFLAAESQVSVLVQLDGNEEAFEEDTDPGYTLILTATIGEYKLEADGSAGDIYEAFSIAKRRMIDQLEEYYSAAIDTTERDAQIQSLMSGGMTIH